MLASKLVDETSSPPLILESKLLEETSSPPSMLESKLVDETTACVKCSAERKCWIHDGLVAPYPAHIAQRINNHLAMGRMGIVELIPPGRYVKKSTIPYDCTYERAHQAKGLVREMQAYRKIGCHGRFIKMVDCSDNGVDSHITLEYLPNGDLQTHLKSAAKITRRQQLQWSLEAAEGVAFLHARGIVHSDIRPDNMLLDNDMCLRIIDLGGASFDNLPPLAMESYNFHMPRPVDDPLGSTATTDMFALGCSIYTIMQRSVPYKKLRYDDVRRRYAQNVFPDVADVPCGDIILKCWTGQYASADLIVSALECRLREETT